MVVGHDHTDPRIAREQRGHRRTAYPIDFRTPLVEGMYSGESHHDIADGAEFDDQNSLHKEMNKDSLAGRQQGPESSKGPVCTGPHGHYPTILGGAPFRLLPPRFHLCRYRWLKIVPDCVA